MRDLNRWRSLLLLGCLMFTPMMLHCGGSFCNRANASLVDARVKAAPCAATVGFNVNEQKCEENKGECSSNDLQKIEATITCLNGMSTCSEETKNTWNGVYADCAAKLQGLSLRCAAIFI